MFERPDVGERAILVHIEFSSHEEAEDLGEFRELVWSAGVEPVGVVTGSQAAQPETVCRRGEAGRNS